MEELKEFMAIAKLQVPTRRRDGVQPKKEVHEDSVKEEEDGSLSITRVEFNPTSSGREHFGVRTTTWPKFILNEPVLQEFYR